MSRLLSEQQKETAKAAYGDLLDHNQRKWRVQQTAAKHITVEVLRLPEESWQTVEDKIIVPVLKQRDLKRRRKKVSRKK